MIEGAWCGAVFDLSIFLSLSPSSSSSSTRCEEEGESCSSLCPPAALRPSPRPRRRKVEGWMDEEKRKV